VRCRGCGEYLPSYHVVGRFAVGASSFNRQGSPRSFNCVTVWSATAYRSSSVRPSFRPRMILRERRSAWRAHRQSDLAENRSTCPTMGPLVCYRVTFLHMPLVASDAVKGIQIRQPVEPFCFAKELHRRGAIYATRRFERGPVSVFAVHDTISN
jgi:hypothetical protein